MPNSSSSDVPPVVEDLPAATEMNYFRTSQSTPGKWMERTQKLIEGLGGRVDFQGRGSFEAPSGDSLDAYVIQFSASNGESYRTAWPVLPGTEDSEKARRRQAATMLHHDCKARALRAEVFGVRFAFFEWMILPDGRTAGQLAAPELQEIDPTRLLQS